MLTDVDCCYSVHAGSYDVRGSWWYHLCTVERHVVKQSPGSSSRRKYKVSDNGRSRGRGKNGYISQSLQVSMKVAKWPNQGAT